MPIAIYIGKSYVYKYDFTGNDGDPPDTDVWEKKEGTNDATIQNNRLCCVIGPSESDKVRYQSKFYLDGEFDIEINFYVTHIEPGSGSFDYCYVGMGWHGFGSDHVSRRNDNYSGYGNGYFARTSHIGGMGAWGYPDSAGLLRIKREISGPSSYNCTFWHYNHDTGTWTWGTDSDGTTWWDDRGGTADQAYIALEWRSRGNGHLDACLDSFRVNEGTVVWP